MPIPSCYAGKILLVDLNTGNIKEVSLQESLYRAYIGGSGLGARILYEKIKPKADPLGPDNVLGFVTGPLTATNVPGSGRYTAVGKSPITGGWGEANAGGYWGPELKWAGFDAVFFQGISPKPVYLLISDGKVELKDASHIWGKNTIETERMLQDESGFDKLKVACIGQAGEKLSLMAGIVNDGGRVAARSGLGAVMGSKKLKAVAVHAGNTKTPISAADPAMLKTIQDKLIRDIKASKIHQGLTTYGTASSLSHLLAIGDSTAKNWSATGADSLPTAAKLEGPAMVQYKLKSYGCQACTIRCGGLVKVREGAFATSGEARRPEYETLAAFGTMCLNDNVESVIKANEICDHYGMDTMGTGGCVAFAIECYENGLITGKDTDGLVLKWGNAEAIVALTEKICKREGFGAILADGVRIAAEKIGKGSEQYAMHIRGHRIPYHDPRLYSTRAAAFLCAAQPACHTTCMASSMLENGMDIGSDALLKSPRLPKNSEIVKKVQLSATGEAYAHLLNASGLCYFYSLFFSAPTVELLAPTTGWNIDWAEGLKAGRRIMALTQAFNAREGITPDGYVFPKRLTEPPQAGLAAGITPDYSKIKESWFEAMDWDIKTGMPNNKTLVDLGINDLVKKNR
jgi:aldehyde:ferredoxin oxidoreductase